MHWCPRMSQERSGTHYRSQRSYGFNKSLHLWVLRVDWLTFYYQHAGRHSVVAVKEFLYFGLINSLCRTPAFFWHFLFIFLYESCFLISTQALSGGQQFAIQHYTGLKTHSDWDVTEPVPETFLDRNVNKTFTVRCDAVLSHGELKLTIWQQCHMENVCRY